MSIEFGKQFFLQGNQDTILSSIHSTDFMQEKLLLIESLIFLNKFDLATKEINKLELISHVRKERNIHLLLFKALCLVHPQEKDEAFQLLESAESILIKIKNSTIPLREESIIFLYSKGSVQITFQMLDESLNTLDQCVHESITFGDRYYHAKSLNKIARVYFEKEFYDRAQESTMKALAIATANNYLFEIYQGYEMLGLINQIKNIDQSLTYFEQSLKLSSNQLHNDVLVAKALKNIAKTKLLQKDLDQAQHHYNESLVYYSKAAYDSDKALILINLGDIYVRRGNYAEAINNYKESLTISIEQEKIKFQSQTLFALGSIYFRTRDFKNALRYYQESLSLKRTTGNKIDMAGPLWGIGHVYFIKHNLNKALNSYLELYEIYKEFGKAEYIAEILLIIITLFDSFDANDEMNHYLSLLANVAIDNSSVHTNLAYAIGLGLSKIDDRLDLFDTTYELFEKIMTNLSVNPHFTYFSLLNLILIDINEFTLLEDKEILNEIREKILILRNFAIKNYNYSIELFSNLILVQLNYIINSKEENESLLIRITLIGEQIQIKPINREMTKIFKKIDQLEKMNQQSSKSMSACEILKHLDFEKFIKKIIKENYWL